MHKREPQKSLRAEKGPCVAGMMTLVTLSFGKFKAVSVVGSALKREVNSKFYFLKLMGRESLRLN